MSESVLAAGETPTAGEPPATGDLVVDAAMAELAALDPNDLDGLARAGAEVERVLRGRLGGMPGSPE